MYHHKIVSGSSYLAPDAAFWFSKFIDLSVGRILDTKPISIFVFEILID